MHREAYYDGNAHAQLAWQLYSSQRGTWNTQTEAHDRGAFVQSVAPEAFGGRSLPRGNAVYLTDSPTVDEARQRAALVRGPGAVREDNAAYSGVRETYADYTASANTTSGGGFWESKLAGAAQQSLSREAAQRMRRALPDIL
ncbi:hypothetical protein [Streptomyces sp. AP-93]|uniref:hypothetical protein n=1 Tax=Streptomyces sp. AP-93 TaxID=2929048 RepID=UPI001FAFA6E8|nr:hypothetical protein [Streptomyces sp. AP-93]MCJ0868097.1 hypothetical protein [Streptomyces sp. AP-93]